MKTTGNDILYIIIVIAIFAIIIFYPEIDSNKISTVLQIDVNTLPSTSAGPLAITTPGAGGGCTGSPC